MVERTHPFVAGLNELGELIWELRPMPRWQMEMFRKHYKGDFVPEWIDLFAFEKHGSTWDEFIDQEVI